MNTWKILSIACLILCVPVCSYTMKKKKKKTLQQYIKNSSAKFLEVVKKNKERIQDISSYYSETDSVILPFIVSKNLGNRKENNISASKKIDSVEVKRKSFHRRTQSAEKHYVDLSMYNKNSSILRRSYSSDELSSSYDNDESVPFKVDFGEESFLKNDFEGECFSPTSSAKEGELECLSLTLSAKWILENLSDCTSSSSDY